MTPIITLYGIPTCGTVRKARKWLAEKGILYTWKDLRTSRPGPLQVEQWVSMLGFKALRNTSGRAYRELGEEKKSWSSEQWVEAFANEPMLIKRPVVELDSVPVLVGFREEEWAALLLS